jgi:alkylated DNA repair dioxygenase AlkB
MSVLDLGLWENAVDSLPITYYPDFFKTHCSNKATDFFGYSQKLPSWKQNRYGYNRTLLPRLETSYGDNGIVYMYGSGKSAVALKTLPWDPWLNRLREVIEEVSGQKFNFCIGNLYRDGDDSIGWHSDTNAVLGQQPVIASVSLGAVRKFQIRNKQTKVISDITLEHGSLLIMEAGCQEKYEHQLPKSKNCCQPRINWTFRLAKR